MLGSLARTVLPLSKIRGPLPGKASLYARNSTSGALLLWVRTLPLQVALSAKIFKDKDSWLIAKLWWRHWVGTQAELPRQRVSKA